MGLLNELPDWLKYFRITVINEHGDTLFDSFEDNISHLTFQSSNSDFGIEISEEHKSHSKLIIAQTNSSSPTSYNQFNITGIQVYTDAFSEQNISNKTGLQLTLVVTLDEPL